MKLFDIKVYRDTVRAAIEEAKAQPCFDCGMSYPSFIMEFDHRDATQKSFKVSDGPAWGLAKTMEEIAKCDLLCGNCHNSRTHFRRTKKVVDSA